MTTSSSYNIPPMQPNVNNAGAAKSDICYIPSAPMQSVSPPSYPIPVSSSPGYPILIPSPPPYAMPPPPPQPPVYLTHQVVQTRMRVPYQNVIVTGSFIPPQTAHINDYMVWSITNVFLGGLLLGWIAILLSAQTRRRKMEGDVEGARSMSKITLICNILITILFFGLTAFLIVYYVLTLSSLTTHNY